MLIAIATDPESLEVEHFSPDYPIWIHDLAGTEVRRTQELVIRGGGCEKLAKAIAHVDVLICTGVSPNSARCLRQYGISVAIVREGVASAVAIAAWLTRASEDATLAKQQCHQDGMAGACPRHAGREREPGVEAPVLDGADGKRKLYN